MTELRHNPTRSMTSGNLVFRGKFIAGLRNAFHQGELRFHSDLLPLPQDPAFSVWMRVLFRREWVIYSKPPFGGTEHVLR